MQLNTLTPAKSLAPAFRAQSIGRDPINAFKTQFALLQSRLEEAAAESEEHVKNLVADFLKNTWYRDAHYINTRDRQDLAIHQGRSAKDPVAVILEVKRPANRAEMISAEKPNTKALHELLRYYLAERQQADNRDIKRLVVTNTDDWFVFDAADFEQQIYSNKKLLKNYTDWREGRLGAGNTDWFYKEIAAPFFEKELPTLTCSHFRLSDYRDVVRNADIADDEKLLDLYKILSPEHLLKKPFANDSNTLNKRFYEELLYVIGLEEEKEGGKKLIKRAKKNRHDGSLLENTLAELEVSGTWREVPDRDQYGDTPDEQKFSIALELCITWLNRILFLKLLEGQLVRWSPESNPKFLHPDRVKDFDELNELFFHVLAVPEAERRASVTEKFGGIPYLNSSLFEQTELECRTLRVSTLKDRLELPLAPNTVLRDGTSKRKSGRMLTLHYLFAFLDAYDFSSDARARIQEENKDMINASVLGLIFEKINGYRDGSFFTPGFITMYMCRETVRRAVLQKFNVQHGWDCQNIETDLYNRLDRLGDLAAANATINSLRICDPAVGSGHFLVSALNELIAVKSDLGILGDRNGRRLRVRATVGNDELLLTDRDTDRPIEYRPGNRDAQTVQEAIFHEKQTLIENCLFGVDINPKSVMICRLRLWVELLKHAYYKGEVGRGTGDGGHWTLDGGRATLDGGRATLDIGRGTGDLQTLPNIDINIKTGNSLVSRFALDEDLSDVFRKQKFSRQDYLIAVEAYKHASSKDGKEELRAFIQRIKDEFRQAVFNRNPFAKKLSKLRGELVLLDNNLDLFGNAKKDAATIEKESKKLRAEIADLEQQLETYKSGPLYRNSFEWRFEFPEVLDDAGDFVGFDVVVGNPPYIRQEELAAQKPHFQKHFATYSGTADLYVYFVERAMQVLRPGGQFSYILPNKWMRAGYGDRLRQYVKQFCIESITDFGDLPVFEEATTYPCVFEMQNAAPRPTLRATNVDTLDFETDLSRYVAAHQFEVNIGGLSDTGWTLTNQRVQNLLDKLRRSGTPLGEYVQGKIYRGVLTGLNEAFVIDAATRTRLVAEDPKSAEVIKPFLAGRDIKRYQTPVSDKFLILFEKGVTNQKRSGLDGEIWLENTYPTVYHWLKPFKEKAIKRGDKGDYWWELRACDYYGSFKKVKILFPDIALKMEAVWDTEGSFCANTAYFIAADSKYLFALLNSGLYYFIYSNLVNSVQGGYLRFFTQYLIQLPVRFPESATEIQLTALVTQILDLKKADPQADTAALEAEIDRLVYALYDLTEEEVRIVETRQI